MEVILAPHIAYVEGRLGEVLGEAAELLDGENVRRQETNLGNLIAAAIRQYAGAEIALQNAGGIRAGIDQGPITFGELYITLPFENYIVILGLSGGDGYVVLKDVESTMTKTLLRDAVAEYIRAIRDRGEKVDPEVEGRIVIAGL